MKKVLVTALLSVCVWASPTTFKGEEVVLNSKGLSVGAKAPSFHAVNKSFEEVVVGGKSNKIQVIAFVPSFDTDTCRLETLAFNDKVAKMQNVEVRVISKDLPFAIGRFCHDNKITNVETLSDYKDENRVLRYGATISAPVFLEGFFGRVVYIVDTQGKVVYHEIVPKIEDEPNYKAILKQLETLSK